MELEEWLPLLDIFTKSPCPMGEASFYLQKELQRRHPLGFLLWRLVPDVLSRQVSFQEEEEESSHEIELQKEQKKGELHFGRCMWIETLPSTIQSSLLTFLRVENKRFRKTDLETLASRLMESPHLDFWSRRAARNLYLTVCGSISLEKEDAQYYSLPEWLKTSEQVDSSLFPWIPIPSVESQIQPATATGGDNHDARSSVSPEKRDELDESIRHVASQSLEEPSCISKETLITEEAGGVTSQTSLDPQRYAQLVAIRDELLNMYSDERFLVVTTKIQEFCANFDRKEVLSSIRPWEAEDEVTLKLVEALMGQQDGYAWSIDMLSSLLLPKLLFLKTPASRILVSAVVQAGNVHSRATVDGLLLPLISLKGGLNSAVCEVLKRTIKECLSPAHVSSFLEKLPYTDDPRQVPCLPCHRSELSNCMVWTESVFTLLQDILNSHKVLRQEAVVNLALALDTLPDEFSKSLKFGNFLLYFVNKYGSSVKHLRFLLENVAKRTNTFMTKSVLSKLASL